MQPLIQVAFLSRYDEFEYAQQGIASEVIAYLLKPISMAQLTQELIEIHRKIEKKQADFSAARQDASNYQAVAAAMLLDCYFYTGREENLKGTFSHGSGPGEHSERDGGGAFMRGCGRAGLPDGARCGGKISLAAVSVPGLFSAGRIVLCSPRKTDFCSCTRPSTSCAERSSGCWIWT